MSTVRTEGARIIIVITGGVGSGKTTLARQLVDEERSAGRSVGGVLSEKRPYCPCTPGDGGCRRWTYEFVDVGSGESYRYARPRRETHGYEFDEEGIAFAEEKLRRASGLDTVVVDEIGPLEIAGGGLRRSVEILIGESNASLVLVARQRLLEAVLTSLPAGSRVLEVYTPARAVTV